MTWFKSIGFQGDRRVVVMDRLFCYFFTRVFVIFNFYRINLRLFSVFISANSGWKLKMLN